MVIECLGNLEWQQSIWETCSSSRSSDDLCGRLLAWQKAFQFPLRMAFLSVFHVRIGDVAPKAILLQILSNLPLREGKKHLPCISFIWNKVTGASSHTLVTQAENGMDRWGTGLLATLSGLFWSVPSSTLGKWDFFRVITSVVNSTRRRILSYIIGLCPVMSLCDLQYSTTLWQLDIL